MLRDVLMKFARLVEFVNTAGIMFANLQICGIGADNVSFIFLSVIFTNSFERRRRAPSFMLKICRIEGQLMFPFITSYRYIFDAFILLRFKLLMESFSSRCLYGVIL